jgi:hypothetical protein
MTVFEHFSSPIIRKLSDSASDEVINIIKEQQEQICFHQLKNYFTFFIITYITVVKKISRYFTIERLDEIIKIFIA